MSGNEPRIEFLSPDPPHLSAMVDQLAAIEASGVFTNFGPVNAEFEQRAGDQLFAGVGACLTVNNATIGLMLAIREAATPGRERRYALMPSFTFAATAHAALWAGLTPLLYDIDPDTWLGSEAAERAALAAYGEQIAVIVPYATFGNSMDLARYEAWAAEVGAGLVVDAAASLGSLDDRGRQFGTGSANAVVYSLHATKVFATAEGGLVHCADEDRVARLRRMANFGFDSERAAAMPGLNAKLPEYGALLALARLEVLESVVAHRGRLAEQYRAMLPTLQFQRLCGARVAHQFMPVALPSGWHDRRAPLIARLDRAGIGARHYFSPHLAEQPYFADTCEILDLPATNDLAGRIVSLPMSDSMTTTDVERVCDAVRVAIADLQ